MRLHGETERRDFLKRNDQFNLIVTRNKHQGRKTTRSAQNVEDSSDEEDEDEDEYDDDFYEDGRNVRTHTLKSMRLDLILKTSLKISRKKIEEAFYGSKIEVNGKKINKKSQSLNEGDEVIFIKSQDNNVDVFELKILKVKMDPDTDNILVKIMKNKSNNAKNYQDHVY